MQICYGTSNDISIIFWKETLFELLSQYMADQSKIIFFSRYYHSILHEFISLEQAGFFDVTILVDESLSKIVDNFIEQLESCQRRPENVDFRRNEM